MTESQRVSDPARSVLVTPLRPGERLLWLARRKLYAREIAALGVAAVLIVVSALPMVVLDSAILHVLFGAVLGFASLLALVVSLVVAASWAHRPFATAITTERVMTFTRPGVAIELEWTAVADVEAVRQSGSGPGSDSAALELCAMAVDALADAVLAAQPKLGREYWSGATGLVVIGKDGRRILVESPLAPELGQRIAGKLAGEAWLEAR